MVNSGPFDGMDNETGKSHCGKAGENAQEGKGRGAISPARLEHQPPALLGRAHSRCLLRTLRHRARKRVLPVELPLDVKLPARWTVPPSHNGILRQLVPKCGRPANAKPDTMDTFVNHPGIFRATLPEVADAPL